MSFLAPLFLLAGVAAALPVVFHLMRRSARRVIPFSSLRFLSETPPPMESRRRLENWPLLLLRLAALCLLVLAFARPAWLGQQPATPPESRRDKFIILMDISASMRRGGLWEKAAASAREAAAGAGQGTRVALATFADQVELVVPFQANAAALEGALTRLSPGWGGTRLDQAVIRAVDLLEEEKRRGREGGGEVVVVTDLQQGSELDGLAQREWPSDIRVTLAPVLARSLPNSGLTLVSGGDDALSMEGVAKARLKLASSQDVRAERFRLDSTLANLHEREFFVAPGKSRMVSAEIPTSESGGHVARLLDDAEEFDNTVYFASSSQAPLVVGFLGADRIGDPNLPLYYLQKLFGGETNLPGRFLLHTLDSAGPTSPPPDLVVVHSLKGQEDLDLVRSALRRGGTALWLASDPSARAAAAGFLSPGGLTWRPSADSRFHLIGSVDFSHPLFAPFAGATFNDFSRIHFWKRHLLAGPQLEKGRVLATFDDGAPLLVEFPFETGLIYLLTAGWTPSESQLAVSSKFAPLLLGMLDQRRNPSLARFQVRVGDSMPWPARQSADLRVRMPDGATIGWPQGAEFKQVTMPGLYQVEGRLELSFAANISPRESETDLLEAPMLAQLGLPLAGADGTPDAGRLAPAANASPAEAEARQRLWKWLLAAAALLILIETAWAARISPARMSQAAA